MIRFNADTYRHTHINTVDCLQGLTYDIAHHNMKIRWSVFVPTHSDIRIVCKVRRTYCAWYAIDSDGEVLVSLEDDTFDMDTALAALTQQLLHLCELLEELAGLGTISWQNYSRRSWDCFLLCDMAYTMMK